MRPHHASGPTDDPHAAHGPSATPAGPPGTNGPPPWQVERRSLTRGFRAALGEAPEAADLAEELLARWAEPHRAYHTTAHLRAVLGRLAELEGSRPEQATDPAAVELAAWFHDAVYDPSGTENEEASARLAERSLPAAGCPPERVAEVARLVRLTAGHDPQPGDRNGEALCDADLAVLAGGPEEYAHYTAAVRREYHAVPDAAFRRGRAAVLRHLLELPRLFRTPYGAAHWERAARYNLRAELHFLVD